MARRVFTPLLLVMLMASAIGLQALRERGGELPVGPDSLLYVRSPAALQRMMDSTAFARLSRLEIGPLDIGAQLADAGRNLVAWGSSRRIRLRINS